MPEAERYTDEQIQEFEQSRIQDPEKAEAIGRAIQESMNEVLNFQHKANIFREVGAEKEATDFEETAKTAEKKADERMTLLGEKYDLYQMTDREALVNISTQLDVRARQLMQDVDLLQGYASKPEVRGNVEKTKKASEKIKELSAQARNLSIKRELVGHRIIELEKLEKGAGK